ncbi:conserved hypothetical protein [uncultured Thiomicrorhabdus sp.]
MTIRRGLVAMLMLIFCVAAFLFFTSSALTEKVITQVSQWSVDSQPTAKELAYARSTLQFAEQMALQTSFKAELVEAQIYQWQAFYIQQKQQDPELVVVALNQAKTSFLQATKIAPKQFDAWLGLLSVKVNLQEFDPKLKKVLQVIDRLKGSNSRFYWQKTRLLLPVWEALSVSQKTQLLKDIEWQLETQSQYRAQILKSLNDKALKTVFCRYLKYSNKENKNQLMAEVGC